MFLGGSYEKSSDNYVNKKKRSGCFPLEKRSRYDALYDILLSPAAHARPPSQDQW